MSIKEKINNYVKQIANQVFDERLPEREEFVENITLPEIDRNRYMALSVQRTHEDLVPDVPAGVAMDSCCDLKQFNNVYAITNPLQDIIYTHFATQGFIGFQACAILCQNWLINKACILPAKDAISTDYDLSYVTTDDTEELDQDFLSEIKDMSDDLKGFNIRKVCKTFSEKKRQFGQVLLYPIVDGVDYSVPFNIDAITPDSYKGMAVVDPLWYEPILDNSSAWDPSSLRFNKPTYFSVKGAQGLKLHHSWCVFGITSEVPDLLKPTYYWGGYPLPQLIYERVYAAEKTANEAPMLAMSKRLLIADINVKSYLTNQEAVTKELEALSRMRDNWGVAVKRPNENIQQIDTSLTDFDEVIMTQYQLVSAASCVPATKLLETQPKGFNSTGEYEDDQYKLLLVSIQEDDFVPILDFHYALFTKSKYGIVRDYTINFKEIDVPTEKERAEINGIKANTISTYLQSGIITEEEARNNLIKDPDSGFNDINDELPEGENEPSFFDDEEQEGNGNTSQNPFSMDEDTEWRSTEKGVPFPLKKGESIKESCKEHFEDKEQHEKDMKNSFNAQSDMMTLLAMDYPEFKETVSDINTVYDSKYKNRRNIIHRTPGFIYCARNEGFNNYKFYDKMIYDEDKRKDWN